MADVKGKLNAYDCPAGHVTVTGHRDEGVTPFMIACPQCDGTAQSSFFRCPQAGEYELEWVSVSDEPLRTRYCDYIRARAADLRISAEDLVASCLDHVDQGGLVLVNRKTGDFHE